MRYEHSGSFVDYKRHNAMSRQADSPNALYDLISTGRPQVLWHCSAADWNLNFIHRLVYIRPVMYSNRTSVQLVRVKACWYDSAYLTQTYSNPPTFAIIFSISISKSPNAIGQFEKWKCVDFIPIIFIQQKMLTTISAPTDIDL